MTTVAITGHRSNRIDNWQYASTQMKHAFNDLRMTHLLQGMCEGVDITAARYAYNMHIPYTAVRPWAGHSSGNDFQYHQALTHAHRVHVVNESLDFPGASVYHERNRWMVDNSDVVVAVWDGREKRGGTWTTAKYAIKTQRPVWMINIGELKVGWLKPSFVE